MKCLTWLQQKITRQYVQSLLTMNGMMNSCLNLDLSTSSLVPTDVDSSEGSDDEDSDPMEVPLPHFKSLDEAISYLGDIYNFLENRGYTKEANSSNTLSDALARFHCASVIKQTSITNHF